MKEQPENHTSLSQGVEERQLADGQIEELQAIAITGLKMKDLQRRAEFQVVRKPTAWPPMQI